MPIQTVPFDQIISSSDWEEIKGDTETILVAKPPKGGLGVSLFQYSDGNHDSPVLMFKPNSRIRISGGDLIFDTDNIVEK